MITCIRDVRRARGMTLHEVAAACDPPTTAQTIGRLETGTRTVSVRWLNRIAAALGVAAADLVRLPERADLPVAALLGAGGAVAPGTARLVVPPQPGPGQLAMLVTAGVGDYRAGDEIWLDRLAPQDFGRAFNRDILVPRPAGRFAFGRLIGRDGGRLQLLPPGAGTGRLQLLPPGAGTRQAVLADPPWLAVAARLVRAL